MDCIFFNFLENSSRENDAEATKITLKSFFLSSS